MTTEIDARKTTPGAPPNVPADARAVLTIDLAALRANWEMLRVKVAPAECAGVIKADAYGLGLEPVAKALTEQGCRTFFVATLEEGRRARSIQPGAAIYILDGLLPGAEAHYAGFDLRPVLSSEPEVRDWSAYCARICRHLPAAIQLDTGMNRLGLKRDELHRIAGEPALLAAFKCSLVMSHLACADEPANPMSEVQRRLFDEFRAMLPPAPASLANSAGTFLGPAFHYDLVRPGIAVYGGRAFEGGENPMRPVVSLAARILQLREAAPGEVVGYGATYKVAKPSRFATIACGYADGFLRALSGPSGHPGPVGYIDRYPVPVVGRVSMDLITVDVTDVPEALAHRGAWVEVMGGRVTLDDLTDRAGTIGYELLSRLSKRVHRVYLAATPAGASLMAKPAKSSFVCQNCGAVSTRWAGKCVACGEWNSIAEEENVAAVPGSGMTRATKGRAVALETLDVRTEEAPRIATGIGELDRVTGGGIVPGSAILIGGEPGIGKSTLLLQLSASIANAGRSAVYFSGEEAAAQVRLRAERLGVSKSPVKLAAETNVANILATLETGRRPDLVVIDSIQTLWADALDAAPGTVSQVRAATQSLIRFAKQAGCAMLLVGHVTKDGQIAGPKVVEHMVDTVLYFEGDRGHPYRILRAVKNRFGASDEIGVFEMVGHGLAEVTNPSELFLGDRDATAPGAAVFAGIEGTRPLLVEIQALVAPSKLGSPRRAAVGWDPNRLSMILAVLAARCGVSFAEHDVFLNVAGGLRIVEPAADLAAAAALLSSFSGVSLPMDEVYCGEISLSGAVRPAAHMTTRLKEAQKLGFKRAIVPEAGELDAKALKLKLSRISSLKTLAETLNACD